MGGLWEQTGRLQFDFLLQQGLRPNHFLLDVGCGSLRAGVHFIGYLEPGHYFGIDINNRLLNAGRKELQRRQLLGRNPTLAQTDRFDLLSLRQKFDYALAHSLFTHLPLNSIMRCLWQIDQVLVPGGRFYATFFVARKGKFHLEPIPHPRVDGPDLPSFFDRDPYHYDFATFQWICEGTGLTVEYLGDWNHPRDQKMMVFTKGNPQNG